MWLPSQACRGCLHNLGIYPVTLFVATIVVAFHVFWARPAPSSIQKGTRVLISLCDSLMFGRVQYKGVLEY